MKHKWIELEEAAKKYSRHTLGRDLPARAASPRSTSPKLRKSNAHPNREANALLRSLQEFLSAHADIDMMVRFNGLWKSLTEADRMNGLKVAYDLDNRLGMATAHDRDLLCECKLRGDLFLQALQVPDADKPLRFADLKKLGFPFSEKTAIRYSDIRKGRLPALVSAFGEVHLWPKLATEAAIRNMAIGDNSREK